MSNYHQVAIAVRDREVWEKIGKEVAEIADSVAGLKTLYDDAELSDIHDLMGNDFLRADWQDFNHWRENGGDKLLQIIEEVASDDGYAYIDIDEYGEDIGGVGKNFLGLFYVSRAIGMVAMNGLTKDDPIARYEVAKAKGQAG